MEAKEHDLEQQKQTHNINLLSYVKKELTVKLITNVLGILRPARLLFAIVVAAVILTAGANDKIGSKPTETSKTKLLRPHMEKILELVNEASNGDGDPLLNRRDKREAGCRGYLQDVSYLFKRLSNRAANVIANISY